MKLGYSNNEGWKPVEFEEIGCQGRWFVRTEQKGVHVSRATNVELKVHKLVDS